MNPPGPNATPEEREQWLRAQRQIALRVPMRAVRLDPTPSELLEARAADTERRARKDANRASFAKFRRDLKRKQRRKHRA